VHAQPIRSPQGHAMGMRSLHTFSVHIPEQDRGARFNALLEQLLMVHQRIY
jgi:hypothetical protein